MAKVADGDPIQHKKAIQLLSIFSALINCTDNSRSKDILHFRNLLISFKTTQNNIIELLACLDVFGNWSRRPTVRNRHMTPITLLRPISLSQLDVSFLNLDLTSPFALKSRNPFYIIPAYSGSIVAIISPAQFFSYD